jgi:hypothetical protein
MSGNSKDSGSGFQSCASLCRNVISVEDDDKSGRMNGSRENELRVLSLFSGCGGLDLGFEGGFDLPPGSVNFRMHPDWQTERERERERENIWAGRHSVPSLRMTYGQMRKGLGSITSVRGVPLRTHTVWEV